MNTKLILDFLIELSRNNNVEWMHAHKEKYDAARAEFAKLVDFLINKLGLIDKSVIGLTAQDCVFRLARDTRFSNDKSPYKNHFGAYMAPGGRKSIKAGYYVHLQPGNESLIAGGVHCLPNDALKTVRQEIQAEGNRLEGILNEPTFKNTFVVEGESLKTMPRDFKAGSKYDKYIKMKNFDVFKEYDDKFVSDPEAFAEEILKKYKLMKPLNDFFNDALYEY